MINNGKNNMVEEYMNGKEEYMSGREEYMSGREDLKKTRRRKEIKKRKYFMITRMSR